MNLPNKLTMFRILLIPILVVVMMMSSDVKFLYALIIFAIASITDTLDGIIARKYNLITDFGKFMDPLADKLLVISMMICLIEVNVIPAWIVIIIVARELSVSIMRAIAAANGKVIAAAKSGKAKTVSQMFTIVFLLLGRYLDNNIIIIIGNVGLYIATALTLYSGWEYFYKNKHLFEDR